MRWQRIISLCFLGLAATAPVFLSALFLGGRLLIREIHWRGDGGKAMQTIPLHADSLKWFEHGQELLMEGRMFDVKKIDYMDGMVVVKGFFDDLETMLNLRLEETGGTGQPGADSGWRLFMCCLGIVGVDPAHQETTASPPAENDFRHHPLAMDYGLFAGHRDIITPPPQAARFQSIPANRAV